MNELEKMTAVRNALMTAVGSMLVYHDAPKDKRLKSLEDIHEQALNILRREGKLRPEKLTTAQLLDFGFQFYGEDQDLLLYPLWVHPFAHEDAAVTDVLGAVGSFADAKHANRVIAGCLPYGVRVRNVEASLHIEGPHLRTLAINSTPDHDHSQPPT